MTSVNTGTPGRQKRLLWFGLFMASFTVTMTAGAALVMTPGLGIHSAPAPGNAAALYWAAVNIAKPTYTPSPVPTFTPTAIPATQVPATQPPVAGDKLILVSISDQHLTAYENGQLIYSFVASTGLHNGTRTGHFSVLDKIPNAYGSTWDIWMPSWLGIYYSGTLENGIHALPILPSGDRLWSGYLGTPISFGCVVLGVDEALELYDWAEIGTPVQISW